MSQKPNKTTPIGQELKKKIWEAAEGEPEYCMECSDEDLFFTCGTVVEVEGRWYHVDTDGGAVFALPKYIQSRDDALHYFGKLEELHALGRITGQNEAKREFRSWFTPLPQDELI